MRRENERVAEILAMTILIETIIFPEKEGVALELVEVPMVRVSGTCHHDVGEYQVPSRRHSVFINSHSHLRAKLRSIQHL
jgi:hypothetical protein